MPEPCQKGYILDPVSGSGCIDIDECTKKTHECNLGQTCHNHPGSYTCECSAGYEIGPDKQCVDVNECRIYAALVCMDEDECQKTLLQCQHGCINTRGSYICTCKFGFRLNSDSRSCTDIDECKEFKEKNLCNGTCVNTLGSYACSCPAGYKFDVDQRTCQGTNLKG